MPRGYLLDTNVVSEPRKARPSGVVLRWLESCRLDETFLSVVTLGEIEQGAARLGAAGAKYVTWLERDLMEGFAGRILDADIPVLREWGRMTGQARAAGRPMPVVDALLGATAKVHSLVLVTRNTADFARMSVDVVDPWASAE